MESSSGRALCASCMACSMTQLASPDSRASHQPNLEDLKKQKTNEPLMDANEVRPPTFGL